MQIQNKRSVARVGLPSLLLLLTPFAAHAVEVSISGQVNRLIMNVDNGEESGVVHADNSVSGTRMRIAGEGELGNGMSAGLLYETQLQSNPSSAIDIDNLDSDGVGGNVGSGDYFSTRQSNVWIREAFGKLTLGQGSGASDGSAEMDVSGTTVIQYSGASADLLGAMEYGDSGVTVGEARSNFDGLGRNDNFRYDAALQNLNLAFSLGNGDKYEASLRYVIAQIQFMVGVWDEKNSGDGNAGNAVSASVSSGNGLNLTAAFSGDDREGDPTNVYFKVGYKSGGNAIAFDWSETKDLGPGDAEAYSFAWVGQRAQGVELYLTYLVESLNGVNRANDIEALAGGLRVKF